MRKFNKHIKAWCITDGSAGMNSQVKGLAEALNVNYNLKTINLKFSNTVKIAGEMIEFGISPVI